MKGDPRIILGAWRGISIIVFHVTHACVPNKVGKLPNCCKLLLANSLAPVMFCRKLSSLSHMTAGRKSFSVVVVVWFFFKCCEVGVCLFACLLACLPVCLLVCLHLYLNGSFPVLDLPLTVDGGHPLLNTFATAYPRQ